MIRVTQPNLNLLSEEQKQEYLDNQKRLQREKILVAFDKYKTNVEYGIENESIEEHQDIITWYRSLLELKDEAFTNIPNKVKYYLD